MLSWRSQREKLRWRGLSWAAQPSHKHPRWDIQNKTSDAITHTNTETLTSHDKYLHFAHPAGLNTTGWAEGWSSSDFELLCADGRRAPLSDWETCNLGVIPPNTVMTRPVLTARVYDFLMKSQVCLGFFKQSVFKISSAANYCQYITLLLSVFYNHLLWLTSALFLYCKSFAECFLSSCFYICSVKLYVLMA